MLLDFTLKYFYNEIIEITIYNFYFIFIFYLLLMHIPSHIFG